jgi:hypothetical protein
MNDKSDKEVLSLRGKVNALSAVLRLGHEAFDKHTLDELAIHIVNNSRIVSPYVRASLVDIRSGWPKILAVMGQPEVNANTEYCINLVNLVQPFSHLEKLTMPTVALLEEIKARRGAFDALEYFSGYDRQLLLMPIPVAHTVKGGHQKPFIWVLEYTNDVNMNSAGSLLPLICQHYGEALALLLKDGRRKLIHHELNRSNWLKPSKLAVIIAIVFFIAMFAVRVSQSVSADFEIVPAKENNYYAPFDGIIAKCFMKNGDTVKAGDKVLAYDTNEREFDLAGAVNIFNKTSAQLDLVQQQSFKDISKRGEVRLLELQKEKSEISITRNKWYIVKSLIKAEQNGILSIGEKDKLEGKAVRAGDKLFEVLTTGNLHAMVLIDEQNASVLGPDCKITMYLHAKPEMPIVGTIIATSPKPTLTEKKTYCYQIRLELNQSQQSELICGMRGVARVSGARVSLGYYLFRNLVLWWRRI